MQRALGLVLMACDLAIFAVGALPALAMTVLTVKRYGRPEAAG